MILQEHQSYYNLKIEIMKNKGENMIIGNNNENNNLFNKNITFENKKLQSNTASLQENDMLTEEISSLNHINPINHNDMYNKSLAILRERLKNKTITMDEFNKKCSQLAKNKQNSENKINK